MVYENSNSILDSLAPKNCLGGARHHQQFYIRPYHNSFLAKILVTFSGEEWTTLLSSYRLHIDNSVIMVILNIILKL